MTIETISVDTSRGVFTARAIGDREAPLVLLLHGFPDTPHPFDSLARRLAESGLRAVAPFARGYHPSPPFPEPNETNSSAFETLSRDAAAIISTLSPHHRASIVGHDNGGFAAYYAMAQAPGRLARAVTMTAGHPAAVFRNTSKMPAQMWKSRYAMLLQIPKLSDWYAARQGVH